MSSSEWETKPRCMRYELNRTLIINSVQGDGETMRSSHQDMPRSVLQALGPLVSPPKTTIGQLPFRLAVAPANLDSAHSTFSSP